MWLDERVLAIAVAGIREPEKYGIPVEITQKINTTVQIERAKEFSDALADREVQTRQRQRRRIQGYWLHCVCRGTATLREFMAHMQNLCFAVQPPGPGFAGFNGLRFGDGGIGAMEPQAYLATWDLERGWLLYTNFDLFDQYNMMPSHVVLYANRSMWIEPDDHSLHGRDQPLRAHDVVQSIPLDIISFWEWNDWGIQPDPNTVIV